MRRRRRARLPPLQLATSWTDAAITRHSRVADLECAPARFTEEVTARLPSAGEAAALELGDGCPVQAISRVAIHAGGVPVEYAEMVLDASAYLLAYEIEA